MAKKTNLETFNRITRKQVEDIMVAHARDFVEFYDDDQLHYFRCYGFNGPTPTRFHCGVGDIYILRLIMHAQAKNSPKNYRCEHNAKCWAMRVLFDEFYPQYDWYVKNFS